MNTENVIITIVAMVIRFFLLGSLLLIVGGVISQDISYSVSRAFFIGMLADIFFAFAVILPMKRRR